MEKIYLSEEEKKILKEIKNGCYTRLDDDQYYINNLKDYDMIWTTKDNSGITAKGISYFRCNPKLNNPSIWNDKKYIITTIISGVAILIAIAAL